jgi:hypothetical protein
MKYLIAILFLIFCLETYCTNNPEYKVSLIPSELLKNAKAVIRTDNLEIEVDSNKATENHLLAITILNKNGYDLSIFQQVYNSFIKINDITIKIYDAEGNKFKSYNVLDVMDYSAINGYTLYEDERQKFFDPQYRKYPFTVEFSYKRKLKSTMFLSNWMPCHDYNCSVEKSKLSVIVEEGTTIRYFESNLPQTCKIEELKHARSYSWTMDNLPAFSEEDFEAPFEEFMPTVYLSPLEFEVDDVQGSFASWQEFGKWIIKLNAKRDTLSPATVKKLQELTNGLTIKEKIEKIYEYMQKQTRYVSIQIGIGGWQPFDALTVDRLAYGDCKALSNYTYSLLKAVGIPSNYTLIMAGENAAGILTNFPSQFFNHAILTVPVENDTLFLECTNPYLPYGHIGSFTDDRKALMITSEGGKLIQTRSYKPEENIVSTRSMVTLDYEGSGKSLLKSSYYGVNFDDVKMLSIRSDEDIKKELYNRLSISNFIIDGFSFDQPYKSLPFIKMSLSIAIDHYASILDNKMIIPLNYSNKILEIPNINDDRKSKIIIRRPQTEIDTVEYKIPEGYTIGRIPQAINLSSAFASYEAHCTITPEKNIIYTRKLTFAKGVYAQSEALKFREFYTRVCQADMMKLSISRIN